jgi:hypothetical protein
VLNFLPLLAERFAANASPRSPGSNAANTFGVPVALFLCTHNAGRSQMALGFFTHLAGDRAIAWSGGADPGDRIIPPRSPPWPNGASTSQASTQAVHR